MFCVIMFHFSDHGVTVLKPEMPLTLNWLILSSARIFGGICNCAFVLTTGYFACENLKSLNFKRIFKLWLEVWFYSVVLGIICYLNGIVDFNLRSLITMLLPAIYNQYWYFSAYLILIILSPFINAMLANISRQRHFNLCLILFAVFSFIPTFARAYWMFNTLGIFVTLYIIAAYIRFYEPKIFKNHNSYLKLALLFIFLEIMSVVAIRFWDIRLNRLHDIFDFVWPMDKTPVVILSAALFIWFKDLELDNLPDNIKDFINYLSSSVFGVYLFHIGRLNIWLFRDIFNNGLTYNTPMLAAQMLLAAVCIFTAAILFDKMRVRFFEQPVMSRIEKYFN